MTTPSGRVRDAYGDSLPSRAERLGDAAERVVTTQLRGRDPIVWLLAVYALVLPNDTLFVPVANVSMGRVAGGVVVAAWGISTFVRRQAPRLGTTQYAMAALVLWHIAALLWTADVGATIRLTTTAIQLTVIAVVIHDQLRTDDDAAFVLSAFVGGCLFAALDVARQVATEQGDVVDGFRFAATGFDVNEFGGVVVIGAGAALTVLALSTSSTQRTVCTTFLVLAPLLLFATGSRGSLVAAVPAIVGVVWIILRSFRRSSALVLVGFATVLLVVVSLVGATTTERYRSWFEEPASSDASASDRVELARRAAEVFRDHPVAGIGPGALPRMTLDINGLPLDAHNTPLDVAAELGIVGLAVLSVAVLAPIPTLIRRRDRLAIAALILLSGAVIQSMTLSLEHSKHFWFAITMCAALAASAHRQHRITG